MGDAPTLQHGGENLGLLDRGRAHQDRLALVVAFDDVVDYGFELGLLGLVDQVLLVPSDHGLVGRDGDGFGRAGHARQLLVEAEVVLQGHGRPGVVLLLDGDPLLGLHRLVQAVGPPATLQDAPGKLVDDLDFAVRDEVVLVPLVELFGLEGLSQLVDVV